MIKQCQSHLKSDEKFICIHKTRLQKEGNKFSCYKCLDWKKSNNYIKNIDELEEEAKRNVAKYVEMQSKIITTNNEMKQKYLQSLTELYHKLNQYFEKQQKSITSLVEQQNQILTQNINKANLLLNQQSVLDSQTIDNFIIFTTLNEVNQQSIENKYTYINKCLERQFNYEFSEIQCRVNQFTTLEFKFDNVPKYEMEQFKILTVDKQKDLISFCKDHQMEKNCICTHEDCFKQEQQDYLCFDCATNNHDQHFKGKFIKTRKKIKTEQSEKRKLIKEQYQMLLLEVESRIDKELIANQQKQQEIFVNSQTMRENLKQLEAQTKINPFNQNPNHIFHNIDQNLLSFDQDMIKLEFSSKLDQLDQLKQQITTIKKEDFYLQCQTTEEQRLTYKQSTFKLKKQVLQYENQISDLLKKLEYNSNEIIIAEIQKSQKTITQHSLYQQQTSEGMNEIKNLIQTVKNIVIESKQISSLQSELKNLKTTIDNINSNSSIIQTLQQVISKGMDEIKRLIQNVPNIVIESNQISSLQQDLKSMQILINKINSNCSTIPNLQYELQTLNNDNKEIKLEITNITDLLQDLKGMLKGIVEIQQKVQGIPKVAKQMNTLQTELQNAIMIINQINQKGVQRQILPQQQYVQYQPSNCQQNDMGQLNNKNMNYQGHDQFMHYPNNYKKQ